jgi:tetratricopeptide (TPR) repeat protein
MKNLILWVLLLSGLLPRGTGAAAQEMNAWGKLQSEGEAAAKQGDYAAAEQFWLKARGEAARFDSGDIRLGITLKALGELYRTRRRYDRAEEIYRELLRSMLAGKAGDMLIAHTEALLAGVCARQDKNDDAEHWYTSAAVHLQTVIGEDES